MKLKLRKKRPESRAIINTPAAATEEIKLSNTSITGLSSMETILPVKEIQTYEPHIDEELLEEIRSESTSIIDDNFEYQKPPLDLLSDMKSERNIDKRNIKDSIAILEETFANFGISVKVNQVSCGPVVTRYELTPPRALK